MTYDSEVGLDRQWRAADECIVKAPPGSEEASAAEATGRNPVARGKCGCKRHLLTEGRSIPIAVMLPRGNRTDMHKLTDLLDAFVVEEPPLLPAAGGEPGREPCVGTGATPMTSAARRLSASIGRHPPWCRVVGVAHNRFDRFRRLLIRWDEQAHQYLAFVHLAACMIVPTAPLRGVSQSSGDFAHPGDNNHHIGGRVAAVRTRTLAGVAPGCGRNCGPESRPGEAGTRAVSEVAL